MIERDPIITAKEVASVDHLSGGRFEFGVGAGWNREEMRNHGTDPRTRMRLLKERIEAMKAIWTEDEASYHGEFVQVRADLVMAEAGCSARTRRSSSAATGPTVLDRVLAFGDAWFPNYAGQTTLDARRRAAGARRAPDRASR